jgi:hypothetical protein
MNINFFNIIFFGRFMKNDIYKILILTKQPQIILKIKKHRIIDLKFNIKNH